MFRSPKGPPTPSLDEDIESRIRAALEVAPLATGTGERLLARLLPQVGVPVRRRRAPLPWPWPAALAVAASWAGLAASGGAYLEVAAPVAATVIGSLLTAAMAALDAALHTLGLPLAALALVSDLALVMTSRRIREVGL